MKLALPARMGRHLTLAVGATTLLASLLAPPPPAHARPPSYGLGRISNWGSRCLDVTRGRFSDGTPVQLWSCNGTRAQTWTLTADETITAGGKCLDVTGGKKRPGAAVVVHACHGGINQRWVARPDGQLENPATQLCLVPRDSRGPQGAALVAGTCESGTERPGQHWLLPWGESLPVADGDGWGLSFFDDFDRSELDTKKWHPGWSSRGERISGPVNKNELTCYDAGNVGVGGGNLTVRLAAAQATCSGNRRDMTGGIITSDPTDGAAPGHGFEFVYGYAEARMALPTAADGRIVNWPAFWLNGHSWPQDGEIDIVEGLDGEAAWHYHRQNPAVHDVNAANASIGQGSGVPGSYSGWHTYGALREPGKITYYYDGREVGTVTEGVTAAPMYLILGSSVGVPYDTAHAPQPQIPSEIKVDYVRVWQRR